MPEKEIHKRSRGLRYVIYRRPPHPEFFNIHARRRIEEKYYQASLWIVGNSHVVTVQVGRHCIAEVVIETGRELPRRGILKKVAIHDHGLDRIQVSEGGVISYTSEFSYQQFSSAAYSARHDDVFVGTFDQRLIHTYTSEGKEGLRPFTLVDFRAERGNLHVRTVNAYPQDLTLVSTDTTFEI